MVGNLNQSLEGLLLSPKEVFADSYVIPGYQREYSWTELEVGNFWDDILERDSEDDEVIYLGTLYCQKDQTGALEVVDGQQRLTTFQLMWAALQNELTEIPAGARDPQVWANLVSKVNEFLAVDDNQLRVKSDHEEDFACELLIRRDTKSSRDEYASTYLDSGEREYWNYARNFQLLSWWLEDRLFELDGQDRLRGIADVVARLSKVRMFRISVDSKIPVHELFESLNARGRALRQFEKVKNYLFAEASRQGVLESAKSNWAEAYRPFRVTSLTFDEVLLYFSIVNGEEKAKEQSVFSTSKNLIDTMGPEKFTKELKRFAMRINEIYRVQKPGADELSEISYGLRTMHKKYAYLVVGSTYRLPLKGDEFQELLQLLECYTFRYMVVDLASKPSKYANLCRKIAALISCELAKEPADQDLKKLRSDVKGHLRSACDDGRFEDLFIRYFENDGKMQEYVLRKLEMNSSAGGIRPTVRGDNQHIEHIYPKNPHPGFNNGAGYDPSKDADWKKMAKFHDGSMTPSRRKVEALNRIGNLLLLEAKINTRIKNRGIGYKISNAVSTDPLEPSCYENSQLRLPSDIARIASETGDGSPPYQWRIEEIDSRQKDLARVAVKAWPI